MQVVAARNKRLVYGRMTGWGQVRVGLKRATLPCPLYLHGISSVGMGYRRQDGPMAAVAGHDINYISLAGKTLPFLDLHCQTLYLSLPFLDLHCQTLYLSLPFLDLHCLSLDLFTAFPLTCHCLSLDLLLPFLGPFRCLSLDLPLLFP